MWTCWTALRTRSRSWPRPSGYHGVKRDGVRVRGRCPRGRPPATAVSVHRRPGGGTRHRRRGLGRGWPDLTRRTLLLRLRPVRERNPHQTPSRDIEMQGDLVIAYSRRGRPRRHRDRRSAGAPASPVPGSIDRRGWCPCFAVARVGAGCPARREERPLPSGRRRRILAVIAGAAALAIAALTIFTAFHGGGGQISPLANDEMVVTDKTLTTSNLQVINTRSPLDYKPLMENGQNPTISPDGRTQILFLRNEDNGSVPYIMNADGSDQRPFIRNDSPQEKCSYSDRPAWSSSGRYVAMVCVHANSEKPYPQISIFTAGGDYVHSIGTAGIPNGFLTWVGNTSIIFVQRPENGSTPDPGLLALPLAA